MFWKTSPSVHRPRRSPAHALPLVTTGKQTAELWGNLTRTQRAASLAACALSVGRVVAQEAVERSCNARRVSRPTRAIMQLGVSALDLADGYVARRYDAATPFGGELDPIADKVANALADVHRMQRGDLSPEDVFLRVARDIGVTLYRSWMSYRTNGTLDIKATDVGKHNSLMRALEGASSDAGLLRKDDPLHAEVTTATVESGLDIVRALYAERNGKT